VGLGLEACSDGLGLSSVCGPAVGLEAGGQGLRLGVCSLCRDVGLVCIGRECS